MKRLKRMLPRFGKTKQQQIAKHKAFCFYPNEAVLDQKELQDQYAYIAGNIDISLLRQNDPSKGNEDQKGQSQSPLSRSIHQDVFSDQYHTKIVQKGRIDQCQSSIHIFM